MVRPWEVHNWESWAFHRPELRHPIEWVPRLVRHVSPEVAQRIQAERQAGRTLQAIANGLNDESIMTPSGKKRSIRCSI